MPEVVIATISPRLGSMIKERGNAAPVEPSTPASTTPVGSTAVPAAAFTRARTPGLAESGAERNNPFWSTNVKPEEVPVVGWIVDVCTREESKIMLPMTYCPKDDAAYAP